MATKAPRLSEKSPYEQKFKTRYRGSGRPARDTDEEPVFPSGGEAQLLTKTAQRRAFAVVHEEQRDRLREIFQQELSVLKRRGVTVVAKDLGIVPEPEDGAPADSGTFAGNAPEA